MTLLIASQLNEDFNNAFARAAGDLDIKLIPIGLGAPGALGDDISVMFARPFHKAGQAHAPRPPGWPYALDWIQLVSAGADLYPDWIFDGPRVTSARGTSAEAIAEFCIAAIFAAAKRMPAIWIRDPADWRPIRQGKVSGAVLGLYGFGGISAEIAPRALALGMRVIALRRSDAPLPAGVERARDLSDLLGQSDHLVLAAPATAETRRLFNRDTFAMAKPGLHLINVARGALVDQDALIEAMDNGRLGLATLDATDPEPLPAGHPLYTHPNVRVSPHTSVFAPDAQARVVAKFLDNLRRYIEGRDLLDIIDPMRGY